MLLRNPRAAAFTMGAITLILTAALVLLALTQYDALDFARIGRQFCCGEPAATRGYDGQFALYIAAVGSNATPFLDGATLRYQRIIYPVTARALALGNPGYAPYTLILLNVIAHSLNAALLAYLIAKISRPRFAWAALAYSVWFGALIAVRLDLNEPLCITFGLAALIAYQDRRNRVTAVMLILSTLTKEIGLVFAAAIALHAISGGDWRRGLYVLSAPVIAFLAWWGVLYITFGTLPIRYPAAQNLLPIPFNGLFAEETPLEFAFLVLWLAIPTLILFIAAAWQAIKRQITFGTALMLAGAAWVMFMPDVSWVDPAAAYRVALPLVVCGLIYLAEQNPRRILWAAGLWGTSFLFLLMLPDTWF